MIEAIINGEEDPVILSELAKKQLKNKKEELKKALNCLIGPHQRLMLKTQLTHIDFLDEQIALLDEKIKR
jgi:transposase